jgi:hypothetical protein
MLSSLTYRIMKKNSLVSIYLPWLLTLNHGHLSLHSTANRTLILDTITL